MSDFNHRCICGGIMEQKTRMVGQPPNLTVEIWYICPFCGAKRPSQATAAPQQAVGEEQVLTQA